MKNSFLSTTGNGCNGPTDDTRLAPSNAGGERLPFDLHQLFHSRDVASVVMGQNEAIAFRDLMTQSKPSPLIWTMRCSIMAADQTLVVMHDLYLSKEALDDTIASGSHVGWARSPNSWANCSSPWAQMRARHEVCGHQTESTHLNSGPEAVIASLSALGR
jgi:hypothetical protein